MSEQLKMWLLWMAVVVWCASFGFMCGGMIQ